MLERELIIAPEHRETDRPVIFLAGPIQGAFDWQSEAIQIIHKLNPDVVIASPRRERREGFNYDEQIDWETEYLNRAANNGVILFWLAKEMEVIPGRVYAQTTRFEISEWKYRHQRDGVKLVLGIEDGFVGDRYIRTRFANDCPEITIHASLEETCREALNLISDH